MTKFAPYLAIAILFCLTVKCQSDMVDWPTRVINGTNPSGFLKKFQISSDDPSDGSTFTVQAIFYLRRSIEWQGVSDYNLFSIFTKNQQKLNARNQKQFASDGGPYRSGDNITLGFNYTFNSSQNATDGSIMFWLGKQDLKNNQFIGVYFKMPDNIQIDFQKIDMEKRQRSANQFETTNQLKHLLSDQTENAGQIQANS